MANVIVPIIMTWSSSSEGQFRCTAFASASIQADRCLPPQQPCFVETTASLPIHPVGSFF
jgi:hypothetical protein